jgi:hypothetical protein
MAAAAIAKAFLATNSPVKFQVNTGITMDRHRECRIEKST